MILSWLKGLLIEMVVSLLQGLITSAINTEKKRREKLEKKAEKKELNEKNIERYNEARTKEDKHKASLDLINRVKPS